MATWGAITLLDSSSPLMEQLNFFHDHTLMILLLITVIVSYLMISLFFNYLTDRFFLADQMIEILWTLVPAIILIFIALPSLRLLYLTDETCDPFLSIKATGHQWYWSYEIPSFKKINFDSYMIATDDLTTHGFRLLEIDNRIMLPTNCYIRVIITATDVLHSWTIPSLGVKVDAIPGRLNQTHIYLNRSGLFVGQCSEICGMNHSFMPIIIESMPISYWHKNLHKLF